MLENPVVVVASGQWIPVSERIGFLSNDSLASRGRFLVPQSWNQQKFEIFIDTTKWAQCMQGRKTPGTQLPSACLGGNYFYVGEAGYMLAGR